ncbi:MAG: DUF3575 domain-containing protein [Tannerellaceae bacterium]|jgi:hypothetical protein|nr:DUF3575 domain-containing protein [Tannerellaceae bacterium]
MTVIGFPNISAQQTGVKSNLLYDITTTVNLGLEVGLAPQWSIDLPVNYNPWDFAGDKKLKHWLIQPEIRYWLCEKFSGHFWGLHVHIGAYNLGGISQLGLKNFRYEGNLYGGGISYGYQWVLNPRWSLEATLGLGYAYLSHAQYPCEKCATKLTDSTRNYFGPTKAGVSLIYIMK